MRDVFLNALINSQNAEYIYIPPRRADIGQENYEMMIDPSIRCLTEVTWDRVADAEAMKQDPTQR